ncbi:uncharacterized protein EAF02_005271 [Botrytis sinoallii]|uniref:uncharacterized protein n=1 Tax=Botrytis sinoallii TaxID=1463999 RepID=UPI0019017C67|nr:uncharacterized protein EAF02_005271 [Botrytis sinoallii]KAF7883351.1 hypothetical protein EAF02_005271 [Botrytis sinoallii]
MDSNTNEPLEKSENLMDINSTTDVNSDRTRPPAPQEDVPDTPDMSKGKLTIMLATLCLSVFLAAIDAVLITPALPTIVKDIGASDSGYSWIGSSYLLAWQLHRQSGVNLIAALSHSVGMLIAARAVQGLGGGGIITLVEISVGDMFSQRQRGLFYGIYGAVWAFETAIGPIIGGAFTEYVSWRWCFCFNLSFDGLSLIITFLFLHIHNPKTPLVAGLKAIDWVGSILIVGATLMFLLGLDFGGVTHPLKSAVVICLIVFGLMTYAVFGICERFAKYPNIPRRIFGNVSLIYTFAVVFCHGACFIAPVFFLPLYFQSVLGATPILSGVWLLPLAVSFKASGIIMGILIQRTGQYLWVIRGTMALLTLALGIMITFGPTRSSFHCSILLPTLTRSWGKIVVFQILLAWGIGANMKTLVICVQALVAPEDIGVATGTLNFIRNLATANSVVLGQVVFQGILKHHKEELLAVGIPEDSVSELLNGGAIGGSNIASTITSAQSSVYRSVVADALSKTWILYTCICFLGLVISFGIQKKELMTVHETTKTGLEAEEEKRRKNLGGKPKEEP